MQIHGPGKKWSCVHKESKVALVLVQWQAAVMDSSANMRKVCQIYTDYIAKGHLLCFYMLRRLFSVCIVCVHLLLLAYFFIQVQSCNISN